MGTTLVPRDNTEKSRDKENLKSFTIPASVILSSSVLFHVSSNKSRSHTMRRMSISSDESALAELKALYPTLSHEELLIAKQNLERYLLLVWDVCEELELRDALTASEDGS